jgi:hypothetical protein
LERLFVWGPFVVGALGFGGLAGWAAFVTEPFNKFAPFSWVAAGLLGALIFMALVWGWTKIAIRYQEFRAVARLNARPAPPINPMDSFFTGQRIAISDFAPAIPGRMVESKTFDNCEIVGPAWIYCGGHTLMAYSDFFDCDFVKVKNQAQAHAVIGFQDITIRRSKIFRVTFLIPEGMVGQIPPGANWITP